MQMRRNIIVLSVLSFMFFSVLIAVTGCDRVTGTENENRPERIIRMDAPAQIFEEAFPMGNGRTNSRSRPSAPFAVNIG